jgi:hypothetical protein
LHLTDVIFIISFTQQFLSLARFSIYTINRHGSIKKILTDLFEIISQNKPNSIFLAEKEIIDSIDKQVHNYDILQILSESQIDPLVFNSIFSKLQYNLFPLNDLLIIFANSKKCSSDNYVATMTHLTNIFLNLIDVLQDWHCIYKIIHILFEISSLIKIHDDHFLQEFLIFCRKFFQNLSCTKSLLLLRNSSSFLEKIVRLLSSQFPNNETSENFHLSQNCLLYLKLNLRPLFLGCMTGSKSLIKTFG